MAKTTNRVHHYESRIGLAGTTVAPGVTFRVLSKSEDEFRIKTEGIFAKNIESKNSMLDHIAKNGADSGYCSILGNERQVQYCGYRLLETTRLRNC